MPSKPVLLQRPIVLPITSYKKDRADVTQAFIPFSVPQVLALPFMAFPFVAQAPNLLL